MSTTPVTIDYTVIMPGGAWYAARDAIETTAVIKGFTPEHMVDLVIGQLALQLASDLGDVARQVNEEQPIETMLAVIAAHAMTWLGFAHNDITLADFRKNRVTAQAWLLVLGERLSWDTLKAEGRFKWHVADDVSDALRLAVLAEEVGELCYAINEGPDGSYKTELLHVATVAFGWLCALLAKDGGS